MAVQSGTYRGVSAAERAAQRRAKLVDATLAVWAGDERVTMTRICAEAGLSERYFYESFRTVEAAMTAVMDAIATEIEETTLAAAEAAGTDITARTRASVLAFVDLVATDPRKGRVAIIEAGALPALRQRRTQLLRHFAHRAAEEMHGPAVVEGHGPAGVQDRRSEIAGLLFIGGMAELVTAWLDGALEATGDELADAVTAMFAGVFSGRS
ncbi:TetR/AcrR family transcriptional regulator [Rhodococcus sp. NPDC003318]|uniref:TetR/AcrR family transcriptional regulator n=1 Tax=Rhodococcus sp. NPDC003318 TaxID=3364503 RepID=UPI0036B39DF3